MKIKIINDDNYWYYNKIHGLTYTQKQYDYVFKYLDFDKFNKDDNFIYFNDEKTEEWFKETYINSDYLEYVYKKSPEGHQYLKEHWGKGIFRLFICYTDKQELKIIVNKIINVRLMRK